MKRKKSQSEGKPKVPSYIVTFSDMVTLLLTFFVMLLSLATTQDPELFNTGRDSFIKSIRGYGLGMLFGKQSTPDRGNVQNKYTIKNPEETNQRTIDATEERIRRTFKQIDRLVKTLPSEVVGERVDLPAVDISFAPASAELNEQSKKSLRNLCLSLQHHPNINSIKLYVLGMSNYGRTDKDKWILSAQRAQTVAAFIAQTIPPEKRMPIFSWGAGPGDGWIGPESPIPKNKQIAISALR
ncbi:MAG: flagellar motor protein MotB [Phycisphaerales bacterium]